MQIGRAATTACLMVKTGVAGGDDAFRQFLQLSLESRQSEAAGQKWTLVVRHRSREVLDYGVVLRRLDSSLVRGG